MWVAAGYAASILARVPTSKIVSSFTAIAPSSRTRRSASMVTTVPPAITRAACSIPQEGREQAGLVIAGGTVVTMDAGRRVPEGGAIAVKGDTILAEGTRAKNEAA